MHISHTLSPLSHATYMYLIPQSRMSHTTCMCLIPYTRISHTTCLYLIPHPRLSHTTYMHVSHTISPLISHNLHLTSHHRLSHTTYIYLIPDPCSALQTPIIAFCIMAYVKWRHVDIRGPFPRQINSTFMERTSRFWIVWCGSPASHQMSYQSEQRQFT